MGRPRFGYIDVAWRGWDPQLISESREFGLTTKFAFHDAPAPKWSHTRQTNNIKSLQRLMSARMTITSLSPNAIPGSQVSKHLENVRATTAAFPQWILRFRWQMYKLFTFPDRMTCMFGALCCGAEACLKHYIVKCGFWRLRVRGHAKHIIYENCRYLNVTKWLIKHKCSDMHRSLQQLSVLTMT